MKKNSLTFILILIIVLLVGYIIYDKRSENKQVNNDLEEMITIVDSITLDYVDIHLSSEGLGYIIPISKEEISNLNVGNNLKERLITLYNRSFYYDIFINNNKLKGFRVKLDDDIIKIKKLEIDDNIYIIFIKENNTIGLFNYEEYYNLLSTNIIDNYNNYKNIKDISDNKIIYLDGSIDDFKVKH
ncbi:MAG: hypothetical protein E7161_00660 [Firmicutes bacterium]|nr:hypothetical protein [Bacillota bacterium]